MNKLNLVPGSRFQIQYWKLATGSGRLATFMSLIIVSCTSRDPKFQQYFAQGQALYEKHCSNCHQKNGRGLGRLYPPLAASDFLKNNFDKSMCLMKYGIEGEIIVNGQSYNKPMPAIPSLTELEIAEIATYIGNSWGHERGLIEVAKSSKIIKDCSR